MRWNLLLLWIGIAGAALVMTGCPTSTSDDDDSAGTDDDDAVNDDDAADDDDAVDDDDATGDDDDDATGDDDDATSDDGPGQTIDQLWAGSFSAQGFFAGTVLSQGGHGDDDDDDDDDSEPEGVEGATVTEHTASGSTTTDADGEFELELASWEPAQLDVTSPGMQSVSIATSEVGYLFLPHAPEIEIGDAVDEAEIFEEIFGIPYDGSVGHLFVNFNVADDLGGGEGNSVDITEPSALGPLALLLDDQTTPTNVVPANTDSATIAYVGLAAGAANLSYTPATGLECHGPPTVDVAADAITWVIVTCVLQGSFNDGTGGDDDDSAADDDDSAVDDDDSADDDDAADDDDSVDDDDAADDDDSVDDDDAADDDDSVDDDDAADDDDSSN